MEPILKYQIVKFTDGNGKEMEDFIAIEKALQISINGKSFSVVMQTPGNEIELALGLLYVEDVLGLNSKVKFETKKSKDGFIEEVNCIVLKSELRDGYKASRSLLSVSSCGICGKQSLEDIKLTGNELVKTSIDENCIVELIEELKQNQPIFNKTGAVHGVALYDIQFNLLSVKEDVGRHNALDKSIGDLIQKGSLKAAKILVFSGRLSFEIIHKCFRSKISVIIAVSAPTTLAIDFAKEFGITLYGFVRGNKFSRYS